MKTIARIPFSEIEAVPALIKDFLNDDFPGFEDYNFTIENIEKIIQKKSESFSLARRKLIFEVLSAQMPEPSNSQRENIEKLKATNTFTVCTGHQLNLFSGPVFFVYKILQTIKTAKVLSRHFPDYSFVPVFWMATEDHDFEEISFFKVFGNRYEARTDEVGAVGKIQLSDLSFTDQFSQNIKGFPFAEELTELIKNAYDTHNSLAEATRFIVQHLFAEYGLLILDGDTAMLKEQMVAAFEDELLHNSLKQKSEDQVSLLEKRYGKVQVNPREINLFYLENGRNRIEKVGDLYQVVDTDLSFTEKEIIIKLRENPEKFSPNALMRPVYQETVLPNIAYIGGNAEMMYWMELKDYFQFLKLPFPVLIPRSSFLILSPKQYAKIGKLDFEIDHLFEDPEQLKNHRIKTESKLFDIIPDLQKQLADQFKKLETVSGETDPTFANLVNAERSRQMKSLAIMEKRLLRAEKRKNEHLMDRIDQFFADIHPNNSWQERQVNFSEFYLLHGRTWLETCLKEIDPLSSEMVVMVD